MHGHERGHVITLRFGEDGAPLLHTAFLRQIVLSLKVTAQGAFQFCFAALAFPSRLEKYKRK